MNKLEINRELWKIAKSSPIVRACVHKFAKECRKLPHGRVVMTRRFYDQETRQPYILCMSQDHGVAGALLVAEVDHGKQRWFYILNEDPTDTLDAVSSHFLQRYAERAGVSVKMPNLLTYYIKDNRDFVKIYESKDEKQLAYASKTGILLGLQDLSRGITKFCTYVSRDMLKPSQEEALETILGDIERLEKTRQSNKPSYKMSTQDVIEQVIQNREWSLSTIPSSDLACSIYSQYFEDEDEEVG